MENEEKASDVSKSRKSSRCRKSSRDSRHNAAAEEAQHTNTEPAQDQMSEPPKNTLDGRMDKSRRSQGESQELEEAKEKPQGEVKPVLQPNQDVAVQMTRASTATVPEPSDQRDLLSLVALFLAVTIRHRDRLLDDSVNVSMNPCDSFGRFVCDGWRSKHMISVRESVFRSAIEATVESVSRTTIPDTNQNAGEQTAALFRSCYESLVKADTGPASDEVDLVREYLAEAGVVWPWVPSQPDVLETSLFLALELGWPAVLDFRVKGTSAHSSTVIVEPSAGFARLLALTEPRTSSEHEQKRYFDALVRHYGNGDDALSLQNWTMLDSSEMHPGASAWAAALARRNVTGALRFATRSPSFVDAFSELWEEYGNDRMHLYVSWCAVQYVSIFTSRDAVLAAVGSTRLPSWTSSPSICLMFTYGVVGDAVFVPYSTQALRSGVRSDVAKLLFSVRKAFTERFKAQPAFSGSTTMLTEWASVKGGVRGV
ncbi:hypothetical protein MRX96_024122 [Rhipicephalus microplus]